VEESQVEVDEDPQIGELYGTDVRPSKKKTIDVAI
jgi:hypothetical protein